MTRDDARDIAWQEANQAALLPRDLPMINHTLFMARLLHMETEAACADTNGDALGQFCDDLGDAIGRLAKAADVS